MQLPSGYWDIIADEAFENVRLYVIRGRTLRALSADELRCAFIDAMSDWAGKPFARRAQLLVADAGAEYQLRGQSPPYEVVRPQVERLVGCVIALMAVLNEVEGRDDEAGRVFGAVRPQRMN